MASQPGTFGVIPQKIDLTPKRHHGYAVLLFILGTLFPPLGKLSVLLMAHRLERSLTCASIKP